MTLLGYLNHSLPSIEVTTLTFLHFTSSSMDEKHENTFHHFQWTMEAYHGSDAYVLLQIHHYDVMMILLGCYNHSLPSIEVTTLSWLHFCNSY
jgi:hypothetical protein